MQEETSGKKEVEMPKTAFAEIINLVCSKSDLSNRTQHVVWKGWYKILFIPAALFNFQLKL